MKFKPDHYHSLGLEPDATNEEIRSAYRRRAKDSHPDAAGGDHAVADFHAAREAYEVLIDPVSRRAYDRSQQDQSGLRYEYDFDYDYNDIFASPDFDTSAGFSATTADIELVLSPAEAHRGGRFELDAQGGGCSYCSSFGDLLGGACPFCGGAGIEEMYLDLPPGTQNGTLYELHDTFTGETTVILVTIRGGRENPVF